MGCVKIYQGPNVGWTVQRDEHRKTKTDSLGIGLVFHVLVLILLVLVQSWSWYYSETFPKTCYFSSYNSFSELFTKPVSYSKRLKRVYLFASSS